MEKTEFKVYFLKGDSISIMCFGIVEAFILASSEKIKQGKNREIVKIKSFDNGNTVFETELKNLINNSF